jgi:beta-lactamase superfamily II metal-dependent hydrolase
MGKGRGLPVITLDNLADCMTRQSDMEEYIRERLISFLGSAPKLASEPKTRLTDESKREPSSTATVRVFNVGQGDTILVELPDETLWLIDAYFWSGSVYEEFKQFVCNLHGKQSINRLIVSHFHYDHIRYGAQIIKDFQPTEVVVPDTLSHPTGAVLNLVETAQERNLLRVLSGIEETSVDTLNVNLIRTTDFPGPPSLSSDPNEHAIAVLLTGRDSRAFLSGDIPGPLLNRFAGSQLLNSGGNLNRTFYKVSHHCSLTSCDADFLNNLRPTEAATSCGAGNRFGHPNPDAKSAIDTITAGDHKVTFEQRTQFLSYVIR